MLNPRKEHFTGQDPTFKNTDALYSNTGITLEVSKKEEEDPRIFLLPLDAEQLHKVPAKSDSSSAVPSASPPIQAAKLLNINLWIFNAPQLPASLSLQLPRKCQLKHVTSAAWLFQTEVHLGT